MDRINWQELKKEFFESTHDSVKGFLGDKGVAYNSYSRRMSKGWMKEKIQRLQEASQLAIQESTDELIERLKLSYSKLLGIRKKILDGIEVHDSSERDTVLEFEVFIKILQKAPEYFKKATYVQKRKIIEIFVSNIVISAQKQVIIKVRPGLEQLFSGVVEMAGVEPASESHI